MSLREWKAIGYNDNGRMFHNIVLSTLTTRRYCLLRFFRGPDSGVWHKTGVGLGTDTETGAGVGTAIARAGKLCAAAETTIVQAIIHWLQLQRR